MHDYYTTLDRMIEEMPADATGCAANVRTSVRVWHAMRADDATDGQAMLDRELLKHLSRHSTGKVITIATPHGWQAFAPGIGTTEDDYPTPHAALLALHATLRGG